MLRYAITNLTALTPITSLDAQQRRRLRLREDLRRWIAEGIDFVQLREKNLEAGEIFALATLAMEELRATGQARRPRLLINGRPDLAAAARADGVHLTGASGELSPEQVRRVFRAAGLPECLVSVSCHTLEDVAKARGSDPERGVDAILFSPVFGKQVYGRQVLESVGLGALEAACRAAAPTPVLALGGVEPDTMESCQAAGAAGVAGIRLFAGEPS